MVFFNYSHSQFLTALIIGLFFPLGFPQMALNNLIIQQMITMWKIEPTILILSKLSFKVQNNSN